MAYRNANPDNGSEYSPIELTFIWELPITAADVVNGPLANRWAFFNRSHVGSMYFASDQRIAKLIGRAILAEFENPAALKLGDYPSINDDGTVNEDSA